MSNNIVQFNEEIIKGQIKELPSSSVTAAGRAVWKKPSSRCTWPVYLSAG